MAQSLSTNSKIVVFDSNVNLDDANTNNVKQGATVGDILALGAKVYEAEVGDLFGGGGTSNYVVQNTLGFDPNWSPDDTGELSINNALFNSPNKVYLSATCKASVTMGQSIRFTTADHDAPSGTVILGQFDTSGTGVDSNEGFYVRIVVVEA